MKNILLLDNDPIFRSNIQSSIEADSQWTILGHTVDLDGLDGYLSGQPIPMLLVGLELSPKEGTELVSWIAAVSPETKVIWLVGAREDGTFGIPRFIDGVQGYILKNIFPSELLFCLQLVGDGGRYLSHELYMLMMEAQLGERPFLETFVSQETAFSSHEVQLLRLAANGASPLSISHELSMSIASVKKHFGELFDKTGTGNYASLIRFAVENGIVSYR